MYIGRWNPEVHANQVLLREQHIFWLFVRHEEGSGMAGLSSMRGVGGIVRRVFVAGVSRGVDAGMAVVSAAERPIRASVNNYHQHSFSRGRRNLHLGTCL